MWRRQFLESFSQHQGRCLTDCLYKRSVHEWACVRLRTGPMNFFVSVRLEAAQSISREDKTTVFSNMLSPSPEREQTKRGRTAKMKCFLESLSFGDVSASSYHTQLLIQAPEVVRGCVNPNGILLNSQRRG